MALWRRSSGPVDRSVEMLEREIAAIQKQIRKASREGKRRESVAEPIETPAEQGLVAKDRSTNFIKNMLTPEKRSHVSTYTTKSEAIDVRDEPLEDLEAEPIAFAEKSKLDLP